MALGQTNITIGLVKNQLGINSTSEGVICTSDLVNKWSKYKPVDGTVPLGANNLYSIDRPVSTNGAAFSPSEWAHIKPTQYRIGDFRGYDHSALPAFYSAKADDTLPTIVYPSGKIDTRTININYKANTTNTTTRLTLSNLMLTNYYIGMRYKANSGSWWYKTGSIVTSLDEVTPQLLSLDFQVSVNTTTGVATFKTVPDSAVGTGYIELFISPEQCTSWTTTAPSTTVKLPNSLTAISNWSFDIANWIFFEGLNSTYLANDQDLYRSFDNTGTVSHYPRVYTSAATWNVISKPYWLDVAVDGDYNVIGEPFPTEYELTLEAQANYDDPDRTGSVVVGCAGGVTRSITVFQDGHDPEFSFDPDFTVLQPEITWGIASTLYCLWGRDFTDSPSGGDTTYLRVWCITDNAWVSDWESWLILDNTNEIHYTEGQHGGGTMQEHTFTTVGGGVNGYAGILYGKHYEIKIQLTNPV